MKITRFEEVEAWKEARVQVSKVYESTGKEPFKKDWGLKKQLMVQWLKVKEFNEIKEVLKRQSEYTFKYKKE